MYCILFTGERQSWKFIKFHILRHIPHHLLKFGWWENCSCQTGERLHKFYLHMIKRLTNNKADWERRIFRIHKREQGLRHIIAEVGKFVYSTFAGYVNNVPVSVLYNVHLLYCMCTVFLQYTSYSACSAADF